MGYLIGEIWLWLLITFVIGLVIGWLIWGRGQAATQSRMTELERQAASAKAQCDACEAEKAELQAAADAATAQVDGLEKQVAEATAAAQSSAAEVGRLSGRIAELEKEQRTAVGAAAQSTAETDASDISSGASGADTISLTDTAADREVAESAEIADVSEADRPDSLSAPDGTKDDLKLISGVGPKLEGVLNDLGIFHFWQIAKWTEREVAWVDDYLSFKGRIERDQWIEQAKTLASGG